MALPGSTLHQLHLLWPSCLNAQLSFQMHLAVARFRGHEKIDNLGGFQLANVRPEIFAMPWHQWILWVILGTGQPFCMV